MDELEPDTSPDATAEACEALEASTEEEERRALAEVTIRDDDGNVVTIDAAVSDGSDNG